MIAIALLMVATASGMIILNDENFADKTKEGVWLVKFYAPWCGHCKKLAPTWDKLSDSVNGAFNVAELDCTTNPITAKAQGIRGYPTIKFFEPPGIEKEVRVPRTIKSFVDYVLSVTKSTIIQKDLIRDVPDEVISKHVEEDETIPPGSSVVIMTKDNFDSELSKGPIVVEFYAPWCGHCKKLAPTWEELSKADHPGFRVGKVNAEVQTELANKYSIDSFPTIFLFAPERVEYVGPRTVVDITKFCIEQITKKTEL